MSITFVVPPVVHVIVAGPVASGKSVALERIARVLREEFGAQVASRDLELERRLLGGEKDAPAPHEMRAAANAVWVLSERTIS